MRDACLRWPAAQLLPSRRTPVETRRDPRATAPLIVIGAAGTRDPWCQALAVADVLRAEGAPVILIGAERAERTPGKDLRPVRVISDGADHDAPRPTGVGRTAAVRHPRPMERPNCTELGARYAAYVRTPASRRACCLL